MEVAVSETVANVLDFGSPTKTVAVTDCPARTEAEGAASDLPVQDGHYITGAMLRAEPESVMDSVVETLVKSAQQSTRLRTRLIDVEDQLGVALDQKVWSERTIDALGLERDRLSADKSSLTEQVSALKLEVASLEIQSEESDQAMGLLGYAVGLLLEGAVEKDDPRVRDLVSQAARIGIGLRTPIRTGQLGPVLASTPDTECVVLPFRKPNEVELPSPALPADGEISKED